MSACFKSEWVIKTGTITLFGPTSHLTHNSCEVIYPRAFQASVPSCSLHHVVWSAKEENCANHFLSFLVCNCCICFACKVNVFANKLISS